MRSQTSHRGGKNKVHSEIVFIIFHQFSFKETLYNWKSVCHINQGPVVQSVVNLTSSLRVISLTSLADSIYNILICFAERNGLQKLLMYSHFFSKKNQHICVSLDVNFNESLTNDIVSFEQLGLG